MCINLREVLRARVWKTYRASRDDFPRATRADLVFTTFQVYTRGVKEDKIMHQALSSGIHMSVCVREG